MIRDFTEETKERLLNEIDDINQSAWSPVTDAIGDALMYAGKFIGIISLDEDMSNVESYQRKVLDMTNMTKRELQKIFDDVCALDEEYKGLFEEINVLESIYNDKLKYLCSVIQPGFIICSAETIRSQTGVFDVRLKEISGKINKNFEKELDWAAKEVALEGVKGFVGGLVKGIADIFLLPVSMVKNVVTGNYGAIFVDGWAIINDVFTVGYNAVGLAALGLGYTIAYFTGNNKIKHEAIKSGDAFSGVSGLTEGLKADEELNGEGGFTTGLRILSQKVDTVSDTISLYSDAKKFVNEPSEMIDPKFGYKNKLSKLEKADMIDEYKGDYRKWQARYKKLAKTNNYIKIKNYSNTYDLIEFLWDWKTDPEGAIEEGIHTPFSKFNKWFKAWENAYDLGEEVNEARSDVVDLGEKLFGADVKGE